MTSGEYGVFPVYCGHFLRIHEERLIARPRGRSMAYRSGVQIFTEVWPCLIVRTVVLYLTAISRVYRTLGLSCLFVDECREIPSVVFNDDIWYPSQYQYCFYRCGDSHYIDKIVVRPSKDILHAFCRKIFIAIDCQMYTIILMGSGNGLAPNRGQIIAWSNGDPKLLVTTGVYFVLWT